MAESRKLLVVVATYNEIDNLPVLVDRVFEFVDGVNLLIIDDNSPDGTGVWAADAAKQNSRIQVIHRPGKLGLGSATKLGLLQAIENGFELVATMDGDLSHDPAILTTMTERMTTETQDCPDVVIGSRYVNGGKIIGWPWYRRFSSFAVNLFARHLLGLQTHDNTSAFRMYSVAKLKQISIASIQSQGYSYLEEILVLLKKADTSFFEVPICFQNREQGKSKVNFRELYRSLFQIVRLSLNG